MLHRSADYAGASLSTQEAMARRAAVAPLARRPPSAESAMASTQSDFRFKIMPQMIPDASHEQSAGFAYRATRALI